MFPGGILRKPWLFESFGGRKFGFGSFMIDIKPRLNDYIATCSCVSRADHICVLYVFS